MRFARGSVVDIDCGLRILVDLATCEGVETFWRGWCETIGDNFIYYLQPVTVLMLLSSRLCT